MANSSVRRTTRPDDDGALEAGIAAEGFIEERGEIFAFEMILHRDRRGGAATVAADAMC